MGLWQQEKNEMLSDIQRPKLDQNCTSFLAAKDVMYPINPSSFHFQL